MKLILTFPMTPPTLQVGKQSLDLFCVRTHESEGSIMYHWQIKEEIQHLNFKHKKLMLVYCYLSLEQRDTWMMTVRFLRSSFGCWHDRVHVLQSGKMTKINVLCISIANIGKFPQGNKEAFKIISSCWHSVSMITYYFCGKRTMHLAVWVVVYDAVSIYYDWHCVLIHFPCLTL